MPPLFLSLSLPTLKITEMVTELDENELLVTLEGQGFASLVYYTKQVRNSLNTCTTKSHSIILTYIFLPTSCHFMHALCALPASLCVYIPHRQLQKGLSLPPHACTLRQYVEQLKRDHPGMSIFIAVEGMDTFFRQVLDSNFYKLMPKGGDVASMLLFTSQRQED